jgi:catechol 2,3-dioxygenase-like lactoylglutathione lyase family enzyme
MKPTISDLVSQFEQGRLTRRGLIQSLAMLVAVESAAAADEPAPAAPPLPATGIDHVSVRVKDLQRSAEFYQSLYGLKPLGEDREHRILRLGQKRVIVSLRQDEPYGQIDHFGISVENFKKDEATRVLTARGLTPKEDWEYGYYVRDPDNAVVQML